MNLMTFEAKKFFRSRKNIAMFIASLFIVTGNYILITIYDNTEVEKNFYSVNAGELSNSISELESVAKNQPEAKKALEITKKEYEIVNHQVLAIEQKDWKTFLNEQVEYDKLQLQGMQQGTVPLEEQQIRDIHKNIALNSYLAAHDLKPEIAGVNKMGFNYTYHLLKLLMPFIGTLFVIILAIDVLNSEKINKSRDFINTLPFSKTRILHAKMATYIIYVSILLLFVVILAFVVGSIFSGAGSWNYPIAYQGISPEEVTIVSVSIYIMKYLALMLILIIFLIFLMTFISLFIQNDFIVLIVGLVVVLLPYSLSVYSSLVSGNMALFPVFYFNFTDILSGKALLANANLTFKNAILCLSLYSLLLYMLIFGTVRFKQRI
ncbi:ABC transporter permease subunit [Listeria sp. PSOL-1]|uniref:ABC transporter permease subunit n=1 Tax=Listeria sp. PSOL-1 TaxID=1844999 RepID=UPI0013D4384E|nr:ABC transporter permease subunit [Listeria sp. PSOL-1]